MGQSTSKEENNTLQHQSLGVLQLLPLVQGQSLKVRLRRQVQSAQRYGNWQRQIRLYLQEDFKQVLYLPESYRFVQEGMCGTSGFIEMECEYYKYTLKNEISYRHHSRLAFEETELWYLLYNLLEAAFLLETICRRIGDVHPSNIVINQKGRIKIVPSCLFPNSKTNYEKIVQQKISDVYIAPQEIDNHLIERGIYPNINPCKAEVFSIGLTLLMAASLSDSYYLYNRKVLCFQSKKKMEHFNEISLVYSTYFCSILNQLLEERPQHRRSSSDFFRELNKYEDDILSLRKFNHIQNKLNQSLSPDNKDDFEPSIADILKKRQEGSSIMSQNANASNLILNFPNF